MFRFTKIVPFFYKDSVVCAKSSSRDANNACTHTHRHVLHAYTREGSEPEREGVDLERKEGKDRRENSKKRK